MASMISQGKEILRISPKNSRQIEYSINQGRTWMIRYVGSSVTGYFKDLMVSGSEILGTTDKGIFSSSNSERTWLFRHR